MSHETMHGGRHNPGCPPQWRGYTRCHASSHLRPKDARRSYGPRTPVTVMRNSPTIDALDAHYGLGQVAASRAIGQCCKTRGPWALRSPAYATAELRFSGTLFCCQPKVRRSNRPRRGNPTQSSGATRWSISNSFFVARIAESG